MDFEKRVKGFNDLAEQEYDTSRLGTDTMDKQKLIAEGPEPKTPPIVEGIIEEEKKASDERRGSEKGVKTSGEKSSLNRSGTKTPLDFSPSKLQKK